MNAFEINKIAGAVFGSALLAVGLGVISDLLFYHAPPQTAGYVIELPDAVETEVVEEEVTPFPVLLASASIDAGETAVRKCSACHSFEQGGANKVGPNLWNVVGNAKARKDDFGYSSALSDLGSAGELWGFEELNGFLENPRNYLTGTSMAFAGVRKPEERADIIAYLNSLSEEPLPLPATE
ncbi:MAG: cytochrome c family protein [Pseudomonadota bacterium]